MLGVESVDIGFFSAFQVFVFLSLLNPGKSILVFLAVFRPYTRSNSHYQ